MQVKNYECMKHNLVTIWIRRVRKEEKCKSQSQVSELFNGVGDRARCQERECIKRGKKQKKHNEQK